MSNSAMNEEDDDAAKDSQPAAPNQSGALLRISYNCL
jgi:hypothetical protein